MSIYESKDLIAHYVENLITHYPMIQAYAQQHGMRVGCFVDLHSEDCLLLMDEGVELIELD